MDILRIILYLRPDDLSVQVIDINLRRQQLIRLVIQHGDIHHTALLHRVRITHHGVDTRIDTGLYYKTQTLGRTVVHQVPCTETQTVRTIRHGVHQVTDQTLLITAVLGREVVVDGIGLLRILIYDEQQVMTDTRSGRVDAVRVIQLGKEPRRGVGRTSVRESRRVQIDGHLRSYGIYRYDRTCSAYDEVLEMTYRVLVVRIIMRIIDDTTLAVVIAYIFGHHERVLELTLLHLGRACEDSVGVVVVGLDSRFVRLVVIVPCGDDLHLVVDRDLYISVEIVHYRVVFIDYLSLHLLDRQGMERVHLRRGLHLVVRRIIESDSRIADEHVRQFIAFIAQPKRVLRILQRLAEGGLVMEHIAVLEQLFGKGTVQIRVVGCINGSCGR